jgi:hypothetical protein
MTCALKCQCEGPGFCARHGFVKTPHTYQLCQKRADYRRQWDKKKEQPAVEPGLLAKAVSMSKAVKDWIAAGRPTRTPERAQEVMDICQDCVHFKAGKCLACGCKLSCKIKMATTSCPLPEPKWTADC